LVAAVHAALEDIVTTAFFSPAKSGRIIWGAGPVFLLPPATNNALGSEQFGLGPFGRGTRAAGPVDCRRSLQPDLVGERRQRPRRRQLAVSPALSQLQPRRGSLRWRLCRSHRQSGGGRGVDRATSLQHQQGDAARQTACQLRLCRRTAHREPGRLVRSRRVPPATRISSPDNGSLATSRFLPASTARCPT
jgi:hypothetical protein